MSPLAVRIGQYSTAGLKTANEDFQGIQVPDEPLLTTKGLAAVIADGVSGSEAGREGAEACVLSFLTDYFSTPESWTVKTSVHKVLSALNRWLYSQGHARYHTPNALVATLSALVIKGATAHLFHIGDTRIYLWRDGQLAQLTHDHRARLLGGRAFLSRAMGIELHIEIDYKTLPVEIGDLMLMTTDGIHDYVDIDAIGNILEQWQEKPAEACEALAEAAFANASPDNLTCQILRVESLPEEDEDAFYRRLTELPFPPSDLSPGLILDGYRILRELHASKRTQLYLALDEETGTRVVLKTPSVNYDDDPLYIEQFLHEEWIGRRLYHPHVMRVLKPKRKRQCLYHVIEYLEGHTLRQWMHDHPRPSLHDVRDIVAQLATGLRAFHRLEMIHQDLKPENVMIDCHGSVKIIDFGSTQIAGLNEIASPIEHNFVLGTRNYTAPEYAAGEAIGAHSDIYSLGVITYELLTGRLPYKNAELNNGAADQADQPAFSRRARRQSHTYIPAKHHNPDVPLWVDRALAKAVHPDPRQRYQDLSELVYDLYHPNAEFLKSKPTPLLERNPLAFWQWLSAILVLTNLVLFYFATR
jgi:serine/threonine protein kinase